MAGGELNYIGKISDAANKQAFALYDAEATKPPVLLIRSQGGVTSHGMALGRWVREAMLSQIKASLAKDVQLEAGFFADIGVQQKISRLGQTPAYEERYGKDDKMLGWYYSLDGFRKLGVDHITVINGPWRPQLTSAGAAGAKVFEVTVD